MPQPLIELYPPRARATNVGLIKAIRAAGDRAAFARADADAAEQLHPSLLAELDWMEVTMPEAQRDGGRRFVDGFFLHHLPRIMATRHAELEGSDETLADDVGESLEFYRAALDDPQQPLAGLGERLVGRIAAAVANGAADPASAVARRRTALAPVVAQVFEDVRDPDWVPLLVECEVRNALAIALDRPSSRMRAKDLLRQMGGRLPPLGGPSVATADGLAHVGAQLSGLERVAVEARLFDLAALCQEMSAHVGAAKPTDFDSFGGELAMGYGHCARCAMMFASTAILSFDPTCPRLFSEDASRVHVPLGFNVSLCPFCGEETRADAPCLFYSPPRGQVIYNFPRMGQFSEEEARQVHRPALGALRDRLRSRLAADDAARFDAAREELTYGIGEFLLAVQMGTTVREQHVYNVVKLANGGGMLVDPTKGVLLELTRGEMASQWASALRLSEPHGEGVAAPVPPLETGASPAPPPPQREGPGRAEALRAFADGDVARARDILLPIFARDPRDEVTRKNLAAALLTLGDRDTARRVLQGDTTWMPSLRG